MDVCTRRSPELDRAAARLIQRTSRFLATGFDEGSTLDGRRGARGTQESSALLMYGLPRNSAVHL